MAKKKLAPSQEASALDLELEEPQIEAEKPEQEVKEESKYDQHPKFSKFKGDK